MSNGSTEPRPFTGMQWTPRPCSPGVETRSLALFNRTFRWTGGIPPNAAGPGSPGMETEGRLTGAWILDGLWLSCEVEQDQYVQGQKMLTWKARLLIGWDMVAQEYRAVGVDSNGVSFLFGGEIEGDRLVLYSVRDAPAQLRFTWDISDPNAIVWTSEMSIDGGPWQPVGEQVLKPVA